MRWLVVFCHPVEESFSAAVHARVLEVLADRGDEIRDLDLYGQQFDPILSRQERIDYHTPGANERPVAEHIDHIRWAQGMIFVYPTWWYGMPAMLKGWLDRVWVAARDLYVAGEQPADPRADDQYPPHRRDHVLRLALVVDPGGPRSGPSDADDRHSRHLSPQMQDHLAGALPHGRVDRRVAGGISQAD